MGLVRFHFSILRYTWTFSIFVPAAHKPTVSYILDSILIFCLFYKIVGEDGVEPPELLSNRFTVCPATSTEYSPITRKPRVSNMFIVLCFPLGCFMPCQPHGVISDLDIHVIVDNDETFWCLLKTSCPQRAPIDDNLTRRLCRTGNYLHRTGCAVTHLSWK